MRHLYRALAAALALLVTMGVAAPDATGRSEVRPAGARRLIQVQQALDPITERKRAAYARSVVVERQLVRARRWLREATAALSGSRRIDDPVRRAEAMRWALLVVSLSAGHVAEVRARLEGLDALGNAFRDQIKTHFAPTHDLIHRLLESHGRSRAAWSRFWPIPVREAGPLRACPVAGPWSLTDTFGAPRPGGRVHAGNDILAAWETPVIAAHDGFAVPAQNPLGGRAVLLRGRAGETYYAHLSGYGVLGSVRAGEVIGFVGNSGNARGRIHHVHFEWRPGGGAGVDPYRMLLEVCGR